MTSIEQNNGDWKEIRSRVDSIANAVFLVAGGALSLSITVTLENKTAGYITPMVVGLIVQAWYSLLIAVLLFLMLKAFLVLQTFLLQFKPAFVDKHLIGLNLTGWIIGICGFSAFSWGFLVMVRAAVIALRT